MEKALRKTTILLVLFFFVLSLTTLAQVRTSSDIRGVVKDPSGAVVPGADVELTDNATGLKNKAVSAADGGFQFQNLAFGKYQLKVSMPGFQTAVVNDIVVDTGRITDIPVRLEVGRPSETIVVEAASVVMQTTSNQVATTVRNEFIQDLPFFSRDVLNMALLVPGAISAGSNSTFNGLPNASMNITIDGVNNNSQRFKSGGTSFFGFAPTRLDAMEEVTVSTSGMGADASGGGSMNIVFSTKRGTDQYHGKFFDQWQNENLNANSFMNNKRGGIGSYGRPHLNAHDGGANVGGPVKLPFMPFLKNKLFFFANFEAAPRPSTGLDTVSYLMPDAQLGNFGYIGSDGLTHYVNVLDIAKAAGYPSTIDPTIQKMLNEANSYVGKMDSVWQPLSPTNPNQRTLQWLADTTYSYWYPTVRLDYNVTDRIRWHGSWNLRWSQWSKSYVYPGAPNYSGRDWAQPYTLSNSVDWTIRPNLTNTTTFGNQMNWETFDTDTNIHMWESYGNRRIYPSWINNPIPNATPWDRNNPVFQLQDNLNWIKGRHTMTLGGDWMHTYFWETSWGNAGVLNYNIGVATGDPITSAITNAKLPFLRSGSSGTTDVSNAQSLYAVLTGRLSSITGSRNVDEIQHTYSDFSNMTQRFARTSLGFYVQDSFRMKPSLTLNYGLRWQVSFGLWNTNSIDTTIPYADLLAPSTRLFHPGELNGTQNPQFNVSPHPYPGDKYNPSPNFGIAWSPKYQKGLLGVLFGGKTVIRTSFRLTTYDEGMNTVSNNMSSNPGTLQTIALRPGMVGFNAGDLLLSNTNLPAFSTFPKSFMFPMPLSDFAFNTGIQAVDPNMKTPYTQDWNFGIQRELARGLVFEARYVGNRSVHSWRTYSLNETNIFENGFLDEFNKAVNNLNISLAQPSSVSNFSNRQLPGQVPLPIFEAAFGARGGMPALSAGSTWTSSTFTNYLLNGNVGSFAYDLGSNSQYMCRMWGSTFAPCTALNPLYNAPGPYALNFFRPNPYVTSLNLLEDNGNSWYHGLQVELRKAYSKGLTLNANWTWSKSMSDNMNTDQSATANFYTLRDYHLNIQPTNNNRQHVIRAYGTYALPIGPGRAFDLRDPVLNRILDRWVVGFNFQTLSGSRSQITGGRATLNRWTSASSSNIYTDGGVIMNISREKFESMLGKFSDGPSNNFYCIDPSIIGTDGRVKPELIGQFATPGKIGEWFYFYGPWTWSLNASLNKEVRFTETTRLAFAAEASNVLNHPIFGWSGLTSTTSTTFGQTTSVSGARSIQLRMELRW
jgi:hypothetical protein